MMCKYNIPEHTCCKCGKKLDDEFRVTLCAKCRKSEYKRFDEEIELISHFSNKGPVK